MLNSTRSILKNLLVWIVVAAFTGYIAHFFYNNPERFEQFYSLSILQIGSLIFLSLMVFLGLGIQLVLMLSPYRKPLSIIEAYELAVTNNLLNYLPLKSGAIGKGLYLKSTHQLALKDYLVALTASQLLWVMVSGAFGCLVLVIVLVINSRFLDGPLPVIGVLLLVMTICCYLLFFYSQWIPRFIPFNRLKNFVQQCADAIAVWHPESNLIWRYCIVSSALFLVFSIKLLFSFEVLGQEISIWEACFLQASVAVSFAISIVPGNLGLKEGLLVGLSALLNIDMETALVAALIDRAAILLPTLLLGPFFLHRLGRNL